LVRLGTAIAMTLALGLTLGARDDHPKDAQDTLEQGRGGQRPLRVGWSPAEPWVRAHAGPDGPGGLEPDLVRTWAASVGARIECVPGGEAQLMHALQRNALDVAVAGFTSSGPGAAGSGRPSPT